MFHHVKELQFNARVSGPDPRFAALLLEQFGGGNGELKAAMQYFVQAFGARQAFPKHYDLLMDIATEEFSHLEIVGATIQMLLDGKDKKEGFIHEAMTNPQFLNLSGGGPTLTNTNGVPWTAAYVNSNGDLTVDLRSDMAAESRAKIVYEYLLKFTDDPYVHDTLRFLMTREVAHYQMFHAALETIQPNFPMGVLQSDPRYSNKYFNMSTGGDVRGPWNEGQSPDMGEDWVYIEDPIQHVVESKGMLGHRVEGTPRTMESTEKANKEMSKMRSEEVKSKTPKDGNQWSSYPQTAPDSPMGIEDKEK